MKKLLLSLASVAATLSAQAQFQYNFSTLTGQTYTPLPATATSINGQIAWDEESYKINTPFSIRINGTQTLNSLGVISGGPGIADDTATSSPRNLFTAGLADLVDKGYNTAAGLSKSPIRMITTGTAPNRLLKIEFRNAAFYSEPQNPGTDSVYNDSASFQYWFYETSNIVEFRYGPSYLTSGKNYFDFGTGPTVGFLKGLGISGPIPSLDKAYYLTGNPSSPLLDSTSSIFSLGALNSYPASGTVYRFNPKGNTTPPSAGIGNATILAGVSIYPTATTGTLTISSKETENVSYTVYNTLGSTTGISGVAVPGMTSADVSALPAGTYILTVTGKEGRGAYRFTRF